MSLQAIVAAIETPAPTTSAKLLMLILANYADADGRCYPGQKTLCDDTGLSERAVRDNLKALEVAELIRRQERRRQDGSKTSDLFFLLFAPQAAKSAASQPAAETSQAHRQMAPSSPAPAAGLEPKEERLEEPSSLRSESATPESDLIIDAEFEEVQEEGEAVPDLPGMNLVVAKTKMTAALSAKHQPVQEAYDLYQDMAKEQGVPVARGLTDVRKRQIERILKAHGIEIWTEAIERTRVSDHLRGMNDRGWTTSLDWMTNPTNFQKIIEGNYNRTGGRNGSGTRQSAGQENADASLRGLARLLEDEAPREEW